MSCNKRKYKACNSGKNNTDCSGLSEIHTPTAHAVASGVDLHCVDHAQHQLYHHISLHSSDGTVAEQPQF